MSRTSLTAIAEGTSMFPGTSGMGSGRDGLFSYLVAGLQMVGIGGVSWVTPSRWTSPGKHKRRVS